MKFRIPYGRTVQLLETESPCQVLEPTACKQDPCEDEDHIVLTAMAHPIGSPSLRQMACGRKNAVLLISDHTRPVPSRHILPHMLSELRSGNPGIDVTLLVATGCHRSTSAEELADKLGRDIVEKERIVVHDCDASPMSELGVLPSGARLIVNSLVAQADLVAAEGFIEPHFFAGFSGGRKSILPGVCCRKTVLGNHCAAFIDSPRAKAGILDGNPVHADMEAAARMAKLAYIVNVTVDGAKRVTAAFAGDPVQAHRAGCAFLACHCQAAPREKGDIVITSNGGAPLDQNIYQAVKGLSTAESAAADGGILIICAACEDGIGGERFYRALRDCDSPTSLLREIRSIPMDRTVPDQWQYQILARILEKHRVIFVTRPELAQAVEEMKMEYAPSLGQAYAMARASKGPDASVTVIPDGVSLIVRG